MKVVFDLLAQQITIDGDGDELVAVLQAARDVAPAISQIQITTTKPDVLSVSAAGQTQPTANGGPAAPVTMKQFVRSIRLNNAAERIAAIAYYLKTRENNDTFAPKDMDRWFTICGLPKPSQMPVAVFDAKRKYGYIDSASHGKWKLTADGENIVLGKLSAVEDEQVQLAK